jgi:diaminopimelate decarboxylase
MADRAASGGLAAALVAENFTVAGGVLAVGGMPVTDAAAAHGTPLFVYDADLFRRSYRRLSAALAGFAAVTYSVKANPNPAVAGLFLAEGAGLEIASAGEYVRARAAGAEPTAIVFAGPGKTDAELEWVVANGIGEVHVESEGEIDRLASIAARLGRRVPVALRVNPVAAAGGGAMLMGGRPSPFGIDEERYLDAADRVLARSGLDLRGVHLFTGTQILDAEALGRQWSHGLDVAARLARHIGRPLSTIDLGGGLGIPYFAGDRALDLGRLAEIARGLAAVQRAQAGIAGAAVMVEPGRFLAGPAGIYVVRVIEVKVSRGERFVIVDGGMNHHLAASGNLGQVVKRDYPVVAATRMDAPAAGAASLVGPLCTPLDVLARRVDLPDLAPGDLVAVLQSGAYGLSASPVGFLSHPMPAELLVDGGTARSIRPGGTFAVPLTELP